MPHKPKPNILNSVTEAEGILENDSAKSRLIASEHRTTNTSVGWVVGQTYQDNHFPFGAKDLKTGKLLTIFDESGEPLDRLEAERADKPFSYFITTGRKASYYEELRRRRLLRAAKLKEKDKKKGK